MIDIYIAHIPERAPEAIELTKRHRRHRRAVQQSPTQFSDEIDLNICYFHSIPTVRRESVTVFSSQDSNQRLSVFQVHNQLVLVVLSK